MKIGQRYKRKEGCDLVITDIDDTVVYFDWYHDEDEIDIIAFDNHLQFYGYKPLQGKLSPSRLP